MNALQELLLVIFAGYVVVKGTLLYLVHRHLQRIAEEARAKKAQERSSRAWLEIKEGFGRGDLLHEPLMPKGVGVLGEN